MVTIEEAILQYAVSKLAGDKMALGLGWLHAIPIVAIQYSIRYGPWQPRFNQYWRIRHIFVGRALKREPLFIFKAGLQTRDFAMSGSGKSKMV